MPPMMPPNISDPLQKIATAAQSDLTGGAFGTKLSGENMTMKIQAACSGSGSAGTMASAGGDLLKVLREQYEAMKIMIPADKHAVTDGIVTSLAVNQSGNSAALSLTFAHESG